AKTGGAVFTAAVHAEARIALDGESLPTGTLRVDVPAVRVRKGGAEAHARSLGAVLTSHELDLSMPFEDATFSADLQGARTDAMGAWVALLPSSSGIGVSGHAHADVHLRGS